MTYFLRLRSARVIGSIALDVSTLGAAKALAKSWSEELGSKFTRSKWTIEVTNEKGETQWTL